LIRVRRPLLVAPRLVELVVLFLLIVGQDGTDLAPRLFLQRIHLRASLLEELVKRRTRILGDLLHLNALVLAQSQVIVEVIHIAIRLGAIDRLRVAGNNRGTDPCLPGIRHQHARSDPKNKHRKYQQLAFDRPCDHCPSSVIMIICSSSGLVGSDPVNRRCSPSVMSGDRTASIGPRSGISGTKHCIATIARNSTSARANIGRAPAITPSQMAFSLTAAPRPAMCAMTRLAKYGPGSNTRARSLLKNSLMPESMPDCLSCFCPISRLPRGLTTDYFRPISPNFAKLAASFLRARNKRTFTLVWVIPIVFA